MAACFSQRKSPFCNRANLINIGSSELQTLMDEKLLFLCPLSFARLTLCSAPRAWIRALRGIFEPHSDFPTNSSA
jgi:hypothetical protein